MATTTDLDRVSPTLEPDATPLMRQDWHHLLFLHWPVDPQLLRPLVPAPLELDLWEGRAWVGLVPFTMTNVRPIFTPPMPWISSFHEINVRTYVHHQGRDPGVWFFTLDASSALAVAAARSLFHLNYLDAEIRFDVEPGPPARVDVEAVREKSEHARAGHLRVQYAPLGEPHAAEFRSLESFLLERYLLFAHDAAEGRLWRGRVHHAAYPVQSARVDGLDETLLAACGIERPSVPALAHYARGVEVKVYALDRLK